MGVLNPVKLVLTYYPENQEEILIAENNPEDENSGTRNVPLLKNFISKGKISKKKQIENISA